MKENEILKKRKGYKIVWIINSEKQKQKDYRLKRLNRYVFFAVNISFVFICYVNKYPQCNNSTIKIKHGIMEINSVENKPSFCKTFFSVIFTFVMFSIFQS